MVHHLVDDDLLGRLEEASKEWVGAADKIREGKEPLFHHTRLVRLNALAASTDLPDPEDPEAGATAYIVHVQQLHRFGRIESIELAGSRALLEALKQLSSEPLLCTYEGLNIRTSGDGVEVPWMQGEVYDRDENGMRAINAVLFLDHVTPETSGYHFLPESQMSKQDICAITAERGSSIEGLLTPEVGRGDVLFYDPMLVRRSLALPEALGEKSIRTVEYWYRSEKLASKHFAEEWVSERKRLEGLAAWVQSKLPAKDGETSNARARREKLYKTIKPDIESVYAKKTVFPAANLCLDFRTGDKIKRS